MIYLDNAATSGYTYVDSVIIDTISNAMHDSWQNPSSLYAANVKEKINKCRANIAEFIGSKVDEIYFTSGASESNNMAIRGWVDNALAEYQFTNVITTLIEHKSILELVKSEVFNACVHYCDVDEHGLVNLESLENLLRNNRGSLVSIHMANNEIGTIQMIRIISELVHRYNGVLHCDATQAFGHIPIDVEWLGIDMLSASGHKLSPVLRNIGFLYKKNDIKIRPLIYGSQERGLRGGTEFTYGIIGLSKALEYCDTSSEKLELMCNKRDYFINLLVEKFGCKLNGISTCRLPNNINITFPQNITGESLLYMLDLSGIKVSTGSACNASSIESSHVLKAIGLSDEEAMKTIRISISEDITYEQIDWVVEEISKCIKIIEGV